MISSQLEENLEKEKKGTYNQDNGNKANSDNRSAHSLIMSVVIPSPNPFDELTIYADPPQSSTQKPLH